MKDKNGEKLYTMEEAKQKWYRAIRKQAKELEEMLKQNSEAFQNV